MKKILFFIPLLLLLFSINNIHSQSQESLLDSTYNYLYNQYYTYKYTGDSIKAKKIAAVFLRKAQKDKDTIQIAMGYTFKSEVYNNDSIYINHLDKLIQHTSKNPTKLFPAFFHYRKGHFYTLVKTNKNEALKEILLAKKYAELTKNDSLKYVLQTKIGRLIADNGNRKKAIEIYKECYEYYKLNKDKISKDDYFSFIFNFSTTYSDLSKNDSALYYNRIAYQHSFTHKDTLLVNYSKFKQGQIHYALKNYQASIDSIKGSLPVLIDDENFHVVSQGYYMLADSYRELKAPLTALFYYKRVDSLHNQRKVFYNSDTQRGAFKYLYQHYKDKGDIEKQLIFLNKIIAWDSIKIASDDRFEETLYDNYERPSLQERETLIKQLEKNISLSNSIKYGLLGVSGIALFLFFYEYRRRKQLKKRFEKLTDRKEQVASSVKKAGAKNIVELNIPKAVIGKVLKGLESFEKNAKFTNIELSLNLLANDLETNPNYLSKIINHYKGIGFSSYINQLRINYVLQLLDTNSTIRKYSIKAIGNEIGYKNAESFSNAFYKKTGLKPSYYIKELEKLKSTNALNSYH